MKSWLQTETVDTAECSAGVFEVMRKKKETRGKKKDGDRRGAAASSRADAKV